VRRVVGVMRQILHVNVEDASVLERGHVIDADLLADGDFGVCSIHQFAGTEAFSAAPARHAFQGGARPLRVLDDGGGGPRAPDGGNGRAAGGGAAAGSGGGSVAGGAGAVPGPPRRSGQPVADPGLGTDTIAPLLNRPGELLRRADLLLRAGDAEAAVSALEPAAASAPHLGMVAWKAFGARAAGAAGGDPEGPGQPRDGARGQARADRRGDAIARAALEAGIGHRLASLPPLRRVWPDPALGDRVVPFRRRRDRAGLGSMAKGSRMPVGPFPVVRLFVHWTGQVDVDLSASLPDAEMRSMGHVSWTRLAHGHGGGLPMVVHSGDIQNAPAGASEFIDVDLAALAKAEVACVGTSPISFRGGKFGSFPCFAGWMGRDAQRSGEVFEPASVRARLDVASGGTGRLPLALDVRRRAVAAADPGHGRGRGRTIEDDEAFRAPFAAALSRPERRLTAMDVRRMHALSRGAPVADPAEADLAIRGAPWIGRRCGAWRRASRRERAHLPGHVQNEERLMAGRILAALSLPLLLGGCLASDARPAPQEIGRPALHATLGLARGLSVLPIEVRRGRLRWRWEVAARSEACSARRARSRASAW